MYRTNDDLEQNACEQKVTITLDEYRELLHEVAAINAVRRLVNSDVYYSIEVVLRVLGIEPPKQTIANDK